MTKQRRKKDQDTAMEKAFIAGVLPEADRRAEEVIPVYAGSASFSEPGYIPVYEWIRRGDGTEVLYTRGQIEADHDVIHAQRAIREARV